MSTEEQRAKWRAAKRAERKEPDKRSTPKPVKDAIVYLRHGREAMVKAIKAGDLKHPDSFHLLALLALNILTGE